MGGSLRTDEVNHNTNEGDRMMAQFYTDPTREEDPHALPDAEVFHVDPTECILLENGTLSHYGDLGEGWFWWQKSPGCLPDGEPNGPFETEDAAVVAAREEVTMEKDADAAWEAMNDRDLS